ncbi:MAG: head GIN domain-containing protein [Cyclobacteriaceae bacterium]
MKKTVFFSFLGLFTAILCLAQDREMRNHDSFSGISVGGGVDLIISQSDEFSVEVITAGDLEDVETRVARGILEIRQRSSSWFQWNDQVEVRVSLPYLDFLNTSGGSDVENKNTLTGNELEIKASGGSDVELVLNYGELEINCSGGSDVELMGNTDFLDLHTSGGSDFDGGDLVAEEADINTSGGSDVRVNVSKRIYARASGASDITYYGRPEYVNVDSSGGADIREARN